ncbi:hypothetical protein Achl_4090 (plasmid) [Pseudarthrobacter chlorophenolicus A6]|uniref:Uncharacterized protein n=1 Tax=Pseudarthrobacter chlorophenolicus (strain ATCC 700700 / DSM 12829 / CIP 107037 / JCM 12360 / KCTC 9906 / NCIMB 13794 / A6) TaxID=452863 RepID=B8HHZ4_PSECP|nr:hypothetical protein [Pseudarthrobacter chlorophenolicus]ACL42041.1 hypothetical protein Achl_4090 [Pseudarthrobacter chlorophenolicus A6]SDQ20722.1 hypothetical protein SAMN04489738_0740 [Pseudarthrobacter chlorophenolicus]
MGNPFDDAFESVVKAEQDEVRHANIRETMARQQAAHARSIAEPYLLSIAPAATSKLTSLRVEPITVKGAGRFSALSRRKRFWPIGATFNGPDGKISGMPGNMLCLTEDGFFSRNPRLGGQEGFDDLVASAYLIPPSAGYGNVKYETPLCVEQGSDRVCVAFHDYDAADVQEFAQYVANQVVKLERAARTGPLWGSEY